MAFLPRFDFFPVFMRDRTLKLMLQIVECQYTHICTYMVNGGGEPSSAGNKMILGRKKKESATHEYPIYSISFFSIFLEIRSILG